MGGNSSRMAEEMAQREKERMAEEMAQREKERRAEREAQRDKEMMAERRAQRDKEMMAEEIAQLRKERMAEREALRRMKRLDDLIGPDIDSVGDHDDLMAVREAQLCMEMMAEEMAQREKERLMDFSSSVKKVVVSDDKDLVKSPDDLRAVRRSRLRMLRRALFCPCDLSHTPPHLRWGDFSSSEKKLVVSAVEKWIKSLDDQRAERRAQLCMKRWVDFGSDVSAVKDFNKLLDDLMAVRRAWLRMERRAPFCHFGPCPCDDFHRPFHLRWWEIPSSVKKLVVSAVDDWINSLDDQFTRMATRSKKSNYADVSMRSDPTIPVRCHSLPRSATRRLESIESSDFGVPFGINRYSSLPRLVDFGSDVSAGEVLKKISDDLRAEREAQRDKERRAMGSLNSSDSDVSLKSDQSKEDVTNFKDRVSPRLVDFSSSEKKHVVADDEDLVESPDDLGGDEPGAVV